MNVFLGLFFLENLYYFLSLKKNLNYILQPSKEKYKIFMPLH